MESSPEIQYLFFIYEFTCFKQSANCVSGRLFLSPSIYLKHGVLQNLFKFQQLFQFVFFSLISCLLCLKCSFNHAVMYYCLNISCIYPAIVIQEIFIGYPIVQITWRGRGKGTRNDAYMYWYYLCPLSLEHGRPFYNHSQWQPAEACTQGRPNQENHGGMWLKPLHYAISASCFMSGFVFP